MAGQEQQLQEDDFMNEKWKYRLIVARDEASIQSLKDMLDKAGEESWELCGTLPSGSGLVLIFKKPVPAILIRD